MHDLLDLAVTLTPPPADEPGAIATIGRVAELAAGSEFEALLQSRIAGPLGMDRTTYFPVQGDPNVAAGGADGRPHPQTPHVFGDELRLPLIGGSVYSTTEDLSRFARMILGRGAFGGTRVLSEASWGELTRRQTPPQKPRDYGLGWGLTIDEASDRPDWVGHNGALAASRATMEIGPASGRYLVVLYTLGPDGAAAQKRIGEAVRKFRD